MNGRRFYELDLLRFLAAFAVVLYHFTSPERYGFAYLAEFTKFGYLGVPVFFIISGFVIALSAEGRSAYEFAVSRVARLYPGLWAAILFTVVTVGFLTGRSFGGGQILANATLLNDYIGLADIDGVYWTLHTELKFYGCIFVLVALGVFPYIRVWLSAWLALSILHLLTGQPGIMGWFISPAWSPFFILGVAMYHMHVHGPGRYNVSVLVIATVLSSIRCVMVADSFIINPALFESVLTAFIILTFVAFMLLMAVGRIEFSGQRWMVTLGALTYPLYLIHNAAGKALIDVLTLSVSIETAVVLTTGGALLVAYGIYRVVERPFGRSIRAAGKALPGLIFGRRFGASAD
ncbi:acyltransferase [Marinobacter sp.]|uniref:acyltransferase family protein n=1 Tax=Marinobacter sp. TaxID=50741 RepID=UPI0019CE9557|nr:acyltransferase [Marinobacter sp.]MBD3656247.1 acyltransferase [Marinobacter sp.]